MNTEVNKQKWIKMVNDTLTMGGKSKITINKYTYAIERFLNAHGNNTKISTFTEKEIIKYLKKKFIDTNLKATTYNFNLAAISYFYGLCFEKEFNKKLLPKAKLAKKLPTILDKKTFINLVNNENNIEHKCWLLLGFCCGLRASEVSRIKIEDIDVNLCRILIGQKIFSNFLTNKENKRTLIELKCEKCGCNKFNYSFYYKRLNAI